MPTYTQSPDSMYSLSTIVIENNEMILTVNNRKNADKLCDMLLCCIKFSKYGGNKKLGFNAIVCEDIKNEHKEDLQGDFKNNKSRFSSPHKMVFVTGKLNDAIKLLKKEISPEIFKKINEDIGLQQDSQISDCKENNLSNLNKL